MDKTRWVRFEWRRFIFDELDRGLKTSDTIEIARFLLKRMGENVLWIICYCASKSRRYFYLLSHRCSAFTTLCNILHHGNSFNSNLIVQWSGKIIYLPYSIKTKKVELYELLLIKYQSLYNNNITPYKIFLMSVWVLHFPLWTVSLFSP